MPSDASADPAAIRCFISYRRADSGSHVALLFDALAGALGRHNVFMDVDTIRPGRDFVVAIERALSETDVVLAIIGPAWLDASDDAGHRRLDDDEDFVRAEIATAIAIGVPIVPVLIADAAMPTGDQLPEEIRPLARRNALVLDHARWHADVDRLVEAVRELAKSPESDQPVQIPVSRQALRRITVATVGFEVTGGDEDIDVEVLPAIEGRLVDLGLATLRRFGATAFSQLGQVVGIFGAPLAHEDDALRALRGAEELQVRIAEDPTAFGGPPTTAIAMRCGVRTGQALVGIPRRGASIAGDLVAKASALQAKADAGQILFDPATLELASAAIEQTEVDAFFRLDTVVSPTLPRTHVGPLVGREHELDQLLETYATVTTERRPRLAVVLAEAGVGKSRLALEFQGRLPSDAIVLQGRCLPYGDGLTYWPIAEALRSALAIDPTAEASHVRAIIESTLEGRPQADRIAPVVAQALGVASGSAPAAEISWAFREMIQALRAERPLVFVVDDLHWATPIFLELLSDIVVRAIEEPLVVVCLARPELDERHPGWAEAVPETIVLRLEPLSAQGSTALIETILDGEVDPATAAQLLSATGGNALFLEELTRDLVDKGTLAVHAGVWSARDLDLRQMPSAVEALLVSRLDRIPDEERDVLERASVVGQAFSVHAVAALSDEDSVPAPILDRLQGRDMIHPSRTDGVGTFEFRHVLLRDAAYGGIPKVARLDLHSRLGTWLEDSSGDRLVEIEEIVGYHFEQAVLLARTVGRATGDLARHATEHLSAAGRRALDRSDVRGSAGLLARSRRMFDAPEPGSIAIDLDRSDALREMGSLREAHDVLAAAAAEAAQVAEPALSARAAMDLAFADAQTESTPAEMMRQAAKAEEVAKRSIAVFDEVGDHGGLARAYRILGTLKWWEPDFGAATEALQEGLRHAEIAGDTRESERILAGLTHGWVWDDTPAPEGIRHVDEILAGEPGRGVEGKALQAKAGLLGLLGRFDESIAAMARATEILEELGMRHAIVVGGAQIEAAVHVLRGDLAAAEATLRTALPDLEEIGDEGFVASGAAQLAHVLALAERFDESQTFIDQAASISDPDDPIDRSIWGAALTLVLGHEGRFEEARAAAEETAQVLERSGLALDRGNALLALSDVCALAGETQGALRAATEAREVFVSKGVIPAIDWAGQRIGMLEAALLPPDVVE